MIEQPDKLNNEAIHLASAGHFPEAIACFKRALTIDQSNYLLWFIMGVTYRDMGKLKSALDSLARAYDIAPHNDDVAETYAQISLTLKQYHLVQEICEEELDFNPLNTHLWNLLGVKCFQTEDYEAAAEFFEQAVYINPYYDDALYNLKDTYNVLKNAAGEAECLKKLKELNIK